jgi:hypothetical protein
MQGRQTLVTTANLIVSFLFEKGEETTYPISG